MNQTARPAPAAAATRRILTLQRQLRTLGRIRTGFSEPTGRTGAGGREIRKPVRSSTFILTSPQEENVEAAAGMWGGVVDKWKPQGPSPEVWRVITEATTIDAILPPGDPLTQYNEFWSGGGCARRCDGLIEQQSGKSCLCFAEHGERWHELPASKVCRPTSRLNVFLDLNDFGYWRVESHSFYGAQELAGTVDLIKGLIGYGPAVPIRLRIDQRVAIKDGKGTPYPVIVVELRGQVGGQILAGVAPKLAIAGRGAPEEERPAIAATAAGQPAGQDGTVPVSVPPVPAGQRPTPVDKPVDSAPTSPARPPAGGDLRAQLAAATTVEQVRALWNQIAATKDNTLKQSWWDRKKAIEAGDTAPAAAVETTVAAEDAVEAEAEPDREAMWMQALALAAKKNWDTATTSQRFREELGKDPASADGWTHQQFLEALQGGQIQ